MTREYEDFPDQAESEAYWHQLLKNSQQTQGICWLPIRHHSPACADMMLQQLNIQQPQAILIEAPKGFAQHLPVLQHPDTQPPIAIYHQHAYFPFAVNSPEWQAIRWASEQQVAVEFIDLDHKADIDNMTARQSWSDSRLLSSQHSQRLQQRLGCRDANELWQRLFEQQSFVSPESFFHQVLLFCAASRACYNKDSLDQMGDLAREQHMRAAIKQAHHHYSSIAVITGGFHTPALFSFAAETHVISDEQTITDDSFLIRYSDELLDARNGYRSGMSYPAFWRWQFQQRHLDAKQWLLWILGKLPSLTITDKQNTFEHVYRLSQLRNVSRTSSYDVLDSLRSCLLKVQYDADSLKPWQDCLSGSQVGQLPDGLPALPLVDDVRERCQTTRLSLDKAKHSHFDLYHISDTTSNAKQRRQLLCQLYFLDIGFTKPTQQGRSTLFNPLPQRQYESWYYHWTPAVEVALVNLSTELSSTRTRYLDDLIRQKMAMMQCHSLEQGIEQLILALQMGMEEQLSPSLLQQHVEQCGDIRSLSSAFMCVFQLSRHPFFQHPRLTPLYQQLWQRLSFHLAGIGQLDNQEALELLVALHGIACQHTDELQQPWQERLNWLLAHQNYPLPLMFSLQALRADLLGSSPQTVLQNLTLVGDERFAVIEALITVVPHWLRQEGGLLATLNQEIAQLSDSAFIERLPKLRALFSAMDAREIDTLSRHLQIHNNWDGHINWLNRSLSNPEAELAIQLEKQLHQHLQQQGLSVWLEENQQGENDD